MWKKYIFLLLYAGEKVDLSWLSLWAASLLDRIILQNNWLMLSGQATDDWPSKQSGWSKSCWHYCSSYNPWSQQKESSGTDEAPSAGFSPGRFKSAIWRPFDRNHQLMKCSSGITIIMFNLGKWYHTFEFFKFGIDEYQPTRSDFRHFLGPFWKAASHRRSLSYCRQKWKLSQLKPSRLSKQLQNIKNMGMLSSKELSIRSSLMVFKNVISCPFFLGNLHGKVNVDIVLVGNIIVFINATPPFTDIFCVINFLLLV